MPFSAGMTVGAGEPSECGRPFEDGRAHAHVEELIDDEGEQGR